MSAPTEDPPGFVVHSIVQTGVTFTTQLGTRVAVQGPPVDGAQRVSLSPDRGWSWTETTRPPPALLREFRARRRDPGGCIDEE